MTTKEGNTVHERRPKSYTSPAGEAGTIIGFYIYLPDKDYGEVQRPTEDRDKYWWKNSKKEYYLVNLPHPRHAVHQNARYSLRRQMSTKKGKHHIFNQFS